MKLTEQEITNALCVNMAQRKQLHPSQVEVVLMWDEDLGFSAEVFAEGRNQILIEANIYEAIMQYLSQQQIRVFRDQIQLDLEDEIVAYIHE
ncbi:DUF2653 family protein [Paenibacillus chitinolyticus]|uniref:DUF2653 domain-containing protein n=1 Tax=Paenibacillus chitinolyticus TaxID=79263 RepID=A0A410WW88_9BACL|nr:MULTISPECIES: DUF2653 family protein [Paenibacillus]EGL17267.1 hypothetical protein HMPREF9413_3128 [Paenibacillus sp. HGF7]EPD80984.1 hypothetical protein HMPREF1207_04741 [Paenibacillus sp. HGH0039]MBV6714872.1 YxcD family protein [Paenibacillus chitinolyticus]MCY9589148.1 YxcD family protein [Paenibacillus chitinolyticus]MCY9594221.1 YxcD family protein [Paenibacillus chitinolyticus]